MSIHDAYCVCRVTSRILTVVCSGLLALVVTGCGGGDDFSKPPADLEAIRARAKAKATQPPNDAGAVETKPTVAAADADRATGKKNDSAAEQKVDPNNTVQTDGLSQGKETGGLMAALGSSEVSKQSDKDVAEQTAATPTGATDSADSPSQESTTALPLKELPDDGQDARQPAAELTTIEKPKKSKSAQNNKSDASDVVTANESKEKPTESKSGMSLLDQLRAGNSEKQNDLKSVGRQARDVIERTGRFAVSAGVWLELRNDLAKRFFIAATPDGRRIAASAGRKSLGVVSTQVEQSGESLEWERRDKTVAAIRRNHTEVLTQPVNQLPGTITAIELLNDGNVVLVGTEDGRILARSSANLQDWDIYAQDLFLFQDEFRPEIAIGKSPITAIRSCGDRYLLIDTESDGTHLWLTAAIVPPAPDPLQLTESEVRATESPVQSPSPEHSLDVSDAPLLSIQFSSDHTLAALVTSDEQVAIFNVESGDRVTAYSAADFDDTQPVAAIPETDQKTILVGLADGRILRRALPGGDSISQTDDKGIQVDYETLYAPEPTGKPHPVTAMAMKTNESTLYFGRLDGSLVHFDVPRKQRLTTERLHQGPIVEIRSTPAGVFTISADRIARLSDTDPAVHVAVREFRLPLDEHLREKQIIQSDDPKQDKFTRRRNFRRNVTEAEQEFTLEGIRPQDPLLALYEHQLRVCRDVADREEIRRRIQQLKQLQPLQVDEKGYQHTTPQQVAELQTEFDFASQPLRRVAMSLSDDGSTVATTQHYQPGLLRGRAPDQPVVVWDTYSKTPLRNWKRCPGVRDLQLVTKAGMLLPSPMQSKFDLYTGRFHDSQHPGLTLALAPTDNRLAIGFTCGRQTAKPIVQTQDLSGGGLLQGVEAFEGAATSLAWSPDASGLFVNIRERERIRLLELAANSLQIVHEISDEPADGRYDPVQVDLKDQCVGATHLLPSPQGRYLVSYGFYTNRQAPYQLRIWKKKSDRWPTEDVKVIPSKEPMISEEMTDTPFCFVGRQDSFLAVTGPQGIGIIDLRTGSLKDTLPLPDVSDRRPVTVFSADGNWILAGDKEGNVWTWNLRSLNRDPRQLKAQAGPITGLALSDDQRFLATVGEENRLRVWNVHHYLNGAPADATVTATQQP